ncbi:hypothetical protein BJX61DRAFT_542997 [Aspergillus egyptiacus]|nr:hypothetical protein BJX61DRAFT_542997 [Aspergillus egyptiacus]
MAAASDYPEPPSQSARQRPSAAQDQNPYGASYREPSSNLRASPHVDAPDHNDPYTDLKRPRACEPCRHLKVRCEPDLLNPDEPCKRCAKSGRLCIVTVPTRKRQKKTEGRVAELERKIEALTASIQGSSAIDALLPSNNSAQSSSSREEHVGRRWLVSGQGGPDDSTISSRPELTNQAGSKRHYSGEVKEGDAFVSSVQSQSSYTSLSAERTVDTPRRPWPTPSAVETPGARECVNKGPDIIDKGLVSPDVALDAFTRYVEAMSGHIPMVVFPPGTQMSEVRKYRPVLFHAIIAVAVGPFLPSAQGPLLQELYKTISERVIVRGEKSLDLVQALLVSCIFYTPPENFEEIKFYQLAQLAVNVGMDIGLYRKSSKAKPFNLMKEVVKHPPSTDPDSPEARRAWLGCYYVSVQTSSALRRPILVRWLPYMDDCVAILENSPDALPSDKLMVQWARLARIIEDISARFFAEDSGDGLSLSEPRFQFTMKAFEKQLEQWKRETLRKHNSAIMSQAEAIVNIYLHENAMVLENPSEDNRHDTDAFSPATASRVDALSSTLQSIHKAIDTICSIPAKELVNIPTVVLARTAFAIVSLIKLYSIVAAPDSSVGQVIEPSSLKVESYLDKVIAHYTAAGDLPGGVTPGKFSTVLSMLREWFRSRRDQQAGPKGPNSSNKVNIPASGTDRNHGNSQANTPLHLLSEVATGNPKPQPPQNPHLQQFSYQSSPDILVQSLAPCAGISPPTHASNAAAMAPDANTTNASSATTTTWAPFPSQPPPAPHRQFYPSASGFDTNGPPTTTSDPSGQENPPAFPDFTGSSAGMAMPSSVLVPELGVQLGYSESDNFSAVWNMMGPDMGVFYPQQGTWFF